MSKFIWNKYMVEGKGSSYSQSLDEHGHPACVLNDERDMLFVGTYKECVAFIEKTGKELYIDWVSVCSG